MKVAKSKLLSMFGALLLFVGSVSAITPNCAGWFYEPKKPDISKKKLE